MEGTKSERDQAECERACARQAWRQSDPGVGDAFASSRARHVAYLERGLAGLGPSYVSLDASRPWLCYWILHSLHFFVEEPSALTVSSCVETLRRCQNGGGGFGGGPSQVSHCAPTYAAVLALCLLGGQEVIDREALYLWFLSVKDASGGFRLHVDGEVDVRGTYTVVAVAALLRMLTPALTHKAADFVLSCQTYEGGFGGEPGNEAHGGYTFCAVAALLVLGRAKDADLTALERWLCRRQLAVEGGFQGRTNKLVDGCYSFWQGGCVALVEMAQAQEEQTTTTGAHQHQQQRRHDHEEEGDAALPPPDLPPSPSSGDLPCDPVALQRYILLCAQELPAGGFRDKPGSSRDYYHTCYNLSGLAAVTLGDRANPHYPNFDRLDVHTVFNIRQKDVRRTDAFFAKEPPFAPPHPLSTEKDMDLQGRK